METVPSEADRLFRAFVRSGDPQALGEVYDRLAPELLRVALHTARDAAEAEDVLQATFVAAIERARSFDRSQRVLPWLVGILANESRKARARAARSPDPARLERETLAGPALDAERAELLAELDAALARIPEAFRPVLQLRLRHGLSVTEIAAALGRPSGTVRSQLARGTELLRRSLPAGLAGALALVATPTRGLAAVRDALTAHAAALHGPLTVPVAIGGILAVKKLVAVAAVLVAAWFLWHAARPAAEAEAREEVTALTPAVAPAPRPLARPEERAEPAPSPPEPLREPLATEPVTPPAPVAETPAAEAETGRLAVHARWLDGAPAAGELVLATPPSNRSEEALVLATGADGTARFTDLEPGSWYVRLLRGRESAARVRAGREADLTLAVLPGVTVEGRVLDGAGEPVAGAEIWLSERYYDNAGHTLATSDARGAFTLRCVGPDHWIGARKRGFAPSGLRSLRGASDDRLTIELRLEHEGAAVRGRVVDETGAPIAGAQLLIGDEQPSQVRLADGSFAPAPPPQRARTDAEGRFELPIVALGLQPLLARARGFAPLATTCEVPLGGLEACEVTLVREARVIGRVSLPDGRPVSGAWIHTGAPERFASAFAWSGLDGRFELAGLSAGEVRLVAEHEEHGRVEGELRLRPGATATWDVELVHAPRIVGRLVDARDSPLAGVVVLALDPDDPAQRVRSQKSDADGHFAVTGLAEKAYRLWVQPPLGWREFPLLEVEDVWPDGAPLLLRVPDERDRCRIEAEVVTSDGTPLAGAELQVWHQERRIWRSFVSSAERGAVVGEGIPEGTVDVELRHADHPWKHLGSYALEAGATLDLGRVAFEPSGRLRARITGLPEERHAELTAMLANAENREGGVVKLAPGVLTSGPLAPGEYQLVLGGEGVRQVRRAFRIDAGAETLLELALESCGSRAVVLALPEGAERPRWIGFSLFDASGALVWGGHADCEADPITARVSAPPGSYRLMAGGSGLAGESEMVIAGRGAAEPPLVLPLVRRP